MTERLRSRSLRVALCLVVLVGVGVVAGGASVAAGTATAGRSPLVPVTPRHHTQGRSGAQNSVNWAGYAVSGTTFSSVSGAYTQPTATCLRNANQQDANWVGIDGFASSDPTVEQVGTDNDCAKTRGMKHGTATYYAWYEFYPAPAVRLSTTIYPVTPGDSITASVAVVGSTYTLTLTDSAGWVFSLAQPLSPRPLNTSAEWITEAPTRCVGGNCSVVQLADFGVLAVTGAHANGLPISSPAFAGTAIDMTNKNGKRPKAVTSALGAGGTSFDVTWRHK